MGASGHFASRMQSCVSCETLRSRFCKCPASVSYGLLCASHPDYPQPDPKRRLASLMQNSTSHSPLALAWQLVRIEKTSFHATDYKKTLKRQIMTPGKHFGKVDIADFDPSAYDKTKKETFKASKLLRLPLTARGRLLATQFAATDCDLLTKGHGFHLVESCNGGLGESEILQIHARLCNC